MNTERCETFLEIFESLNHGCNHASSYWLTRLADGEDSRDALVKNLTGRNKFQARFPIELGPVRGDWKAVATDLAVRWFFEQAYSPKATGKESARAVAKRFVYSLEKLTEASVAYHVGGEGAMLPAVVWEAMVFSNGQTNWLLEFGWDD